MTIDAIAAMDLLTMIVVSVYCMLSNQEQPVIVQMAIIQQDVEVMKVFATLCVIETNVLDLVQMNV